MKIESHWKSLSAGFAAAFCIEMALTGYYHLSDMVPPKLQQEFDQADSQMPLVNTEIQRLNAYQKEHQYPYEAMAAMLAVKPDDVIFRNLTIGEYPDGSWMHFDLEAKDLNGIQAYVGTLAANDFFKEIQVTGTEEQQGTTVAHVVIKKSGGMNHEG